MNFLAAIHYNAYTQWIFFEIILNKTEIGLYLPFSDWFGTKRTSVWFKINQKMLNTIWFQFDLIRFRKDFSVHASWQEKWQVCKTNLPLLIWSPPNSNTSGSRFIFSLPFSYFLFILYFHRCILPDYLSVSSLASLPLLPCCHQTTTTTDSIQRPLNSASRVLFDFVKYFEFKYVARISTKTSSMIFQCNQCIYIL